MHSLVSVIIPVYNVDKYIGRCMDSILGQTYKNLEIIPVDDGSTDGCGEILKRYAGRDPRVKVVHQENKGRVAVRKTGLEAAKGEYVFFVDGDDWLEPNAIELLLRRATETGADITMGLYQIVDDAGNVSPSIFLAQDWVYDRDMYIKQAMRMKISSSLCVKLYKKHLFDPGSFDFPREFSAAEDHVANCSTYKYIAKVAGVKEPLYNYYMRSDSICHTFSPSIAYYRKLYELSVHKMGKEISRQYDRYHRFKFLGIYINILYSYLHKGVSYVGTEDYEYVKKTAKDDNVIGLLPFKERLRAEIAFRPWLFHNIVRMVDLARGKGLRRYKKFRDM